MPRGNRGAATSKHPTPEPEPEPETQPQRPVTYGDMQGIAEKLADLQRIEEKLAALEKERERRFTAGLVPAFVYRVDEIDEDQLSPSVGSDGSRSVTVSPKHDGASGTEQAALLGSSEEPELAQRRRSTEDNSMLRSTSGLHHTKIISSESTQLPEGTSSCSSWCEKLLGRVCGTSWSNTSSTCNSSSSTASGVGGGGGGGGLGGGSREDADRRVYDLSSFGSADVVADARAGAATGDLFADFEAKAKLFEQLAADASVEVSFAEQEEQQEEKSRLI